jgi:hypothetical protein
MCVCMCVCPGITLECLEQFRPNLVHICLYVCVKILYIYIYIFYLLSINLRRRHDVGGLHGIPHRLSVAARVTLMQIGIEATAR